MKKLSLFALAAAGMLLGSCSSDDDVAVKNAVTEDFKDGAFIGLSLQLPSADDATRANDSLSNGTADEFEVHNATLYIFRALASETNPDKNAKYFDYVALGTNYVKDQQGPIDADEWGIQTPKVTTNITSTYSEATLIPNDLASQMKSDTENKYYAYVIVNHNGQIPAVTKNETTFETFSNTAFTEIGADIAAKKNIHESGLLMTNAPICDKSGGSAAPADGAKYTTLVELDQSKIFGSKTLAEQSPAACVYVERAAVKITVESGLPSDPKIGDMPITLVGWQVINNEPSYYNTRHIEAAWGPYFNAQAKTASAKYRFVSLYPFAPKIPADQNHTTGYRTYFAKDLQYDKAATLQNTVASDARPWIPVGKQNHAYTTENTFDVTNMVWKNTTMVTLKVQIGDGKSGFYTVGKGSQVMYATVDDVKAAIQNVVKNDPAVTKAYNDLLNKISDNNKDVEVKAGMTVDFTAPTVATNDVKFTIVPAFTIDGAAADYTGDGEAALKTALEAAIANVIAVADPESETPKTKTADAVLLSYYAGGISYYNARIKHFGDYETPWDATADYVTGGGANVDEIYGTDTDARTKNFLGRYGVVRDNWYKLSIDKIGKIGTAEPVDPSKTTPDTPDDEIENFIAVHVHIVPWVLREQSVQF